MHAGDFDFDESGWLELTEAVRDDVMRPALDDIQHDARRNVDKRSGALARSIETDVTSWDSGYVGSDKEYAAAHELGADPHNIPEAFGRPRPFGEHGRFEGKFHPGNKAEPYLRPALYKERELGDG